MDMRLFLILSATPGARIKPRIWLVHLVSKEEAREVNQLPWRNLGSRTQSTTTTTTTTEHRSEVWVCMANQCRFTSAFDLWKVWCLFSQSYKCSKPRQRPLWVTLLELCLSPLTDLGIKQWRQTNNLLQRSFTILFSSCWPSLSLKKRICPVTGKPTSNHGLINTNHVQWRESLSTVLSPGHQRNGARRSDWWSVPHASVILLCATRVLIAANADILVGNPQPKWILASSLMNAQRHNRVPEVSLSISAVDFPMNAAMFLLAWLQSAIWEAGCLDHTQGWRSSDAPPLKSSLGISLSCSTAIRGWILVTLS